MGVTGFVLSLVGLVTCGLLAPLGVLFSAIGMRKKPKGLAIAGLVIGLVGLCGWGSIYVVFGAFIKAIGGFASPEGETQFELKIYAGLLDAQKQRQGSYPKSLNQIPSLQQLPFKIIDTTDGWGTPYRYTVAPDGASFELVSAGPDQQFGTADDIRPNTP